jgi:hypothetical protein
MEVQASPVELPEWHEFWGAVQVRVRGPEGRKALERYTTGRRTEVPTTNGDRRARAGPGRRAPRRQECRTTRPWDEADLHRQRGQQMSAAATRGEGVRVCDEPGCATHGTASVGGARQDAGPLGQVGHGQIAVPCC